MKLIVPIFACITAIFLHTAVFSQSAEGKVEYQKGDKLVATLELPYSSDIVEDAIKEFMEKKGAKTDRNRGFSIFRNARLKENDNEMCDVHCKVERKAQKDKESCIVYVLIGRPGENIAVRTSDDRFKVSEAKELLNRMQPGIEAYNLNVEIKKQEDQVK